MRLNHPQLKFVTQPLHTHAFRPIRWRKLPSRTAGRANGLAAAFSLENRGLNDCQNLEYFPCPQLEVWTNRSL
jgi:hypothetical protein